MTFVGKILVILITVFAVFFLAVSTVVFLTEKNWKDESVRLKTELDKASRVRDDANTKYEEAERAFETAKADFEKQTRDVEARIEDLNRRNQASQEELTATREMAAKATEELRKAHNEAEARNQEAAKLRELLARVQEQANQFKRAQLDLEEKRRTLERELRVAERNNQDLRDRVGAFAAALRRNGLSDDIQQIRGVNSVPPDTLEGYVKRVSGNRVEISIGADDGLVVGHELQVWRTKPTPEYVGRIRVEVVDPNQAVGIVIGKTYQGKPIQEGDIVAPKIRPRS